MLPPSYFEGLEKQITRAVDETNWELRRMQFDTRRMSKDDLVRALDRGDATAGTTDRTMAWHDQILEVNWAVEARTENIKVSVKLQGIASKMALLQHNVELDAEKLGAEIDAADAKRLAVMPKASAAVAATQKNLAGVEDFIASIDAAANGGPV